MGRDGTQVINAGYKPYYLTGSDETPAICLEDGIQASGSYGVPVYTYGGTCINCAYPIQVVLDFNPCDGHYYCRCPACNKVWRWLNPDGSLSDFKEVPQQNKPKLLQELSDGFEDNWGETSAANW